MKIEGKIDSIKKLFSTKKSAKNPVFELLTSNIVLFYA
jgi:hypothetical protein